VGRSLDEAEARLARLKLQPEIRWVEGKREGVLQQRPEPGLAAAPGMKISLVVAR
jgi:hypothetical protein